MAEGEGETDQGAQNEGGGGNAKGDKPPSEEALVEGCHSLPFELVRATNEKEIG